ncbi:MAG TPA: NADH-quinone oxidoreductase subunit NuoK [Myxococcales bacterium]|jgi:NADH-quinone oxidoreductase subunit K|nr:NADH-quinone oxidoreductase subunit NuoK [Myxococcales bacterium]
MFTPALPHFLIVGAVLFALGTYTCITRTNAVGILMGVELILNAANVNFVAFNKYSPSPVLTGQVFALMVIVMAAAEAAVALAIVLAIYMNMKTIDVTEADTLRE